MATKTYTETVIEETPFPLSVGELPFNSTQVQSNGSFSEAKIPSQELPAPKFATELLSQSLNTKARKILQAFDLVGFGGLQIGKFENGVSGDVKITPAGITGRDSAGNITITVDAETGDVTVSGTIRASTLESSNILTGLLDVGNSGNQSYVRLDGANNRIVIHDGTTPRIVIGNV